MSILKATTHVIYFVKNLNGTPTKIGKKTVRNLDLNKPVVKWKKRAFFIEYTAPMFHVEGKYFYLFDVDYGQLRFSNDDVMIDPQLTNEIWGKETLRQIVAQANKKNLFDIAYIGMIILFTFGFVFGMLIGPYIMGGF